MAAAPAVLAGTASHLYKYDNPLRKGEVKTVTLGGKTYNIGNIYGLSTRAGGGAPMTSVIREAKGEEKFYSKEAAGTFTLNGVMEQYWDDFPVSVVWGEGNNVYFKDIISTIACDSYVKGTLSGNTITVPANQTIEVDEDYGYGINVGILKTQITGSWVDFFYDPSITEYSFTVGDDGSLELVLPGEPFDGKNPTQYVLGCYYTDDLAFLGFSDYFQSYTPSLHQLVTMPEGVEPEPYVFIDEFNFADLVYVAFKGNSMYIQGLSAMLPEAVVRADISGNTATIPQNEYLGVYMDSYFIFTKVLYANPDYNENDFDSNPYLMAPPEAGYTLKIDRDSGTIVADTPDVYLSFQPDEDTWENSITVLSQFTLYYQDSAAGTPANPTNLRYETKFAYAQGFNDFFFSLSNFSTENKLIEVEHLYYRVLVNGQPVVFGEQVLQNLNGIDAIAYPYVPEKQIWLPYEFNNNEDIFKLSSNEFDIGIYTADVETIGVQSLYIYDNVSTYSDIVTLNVATGEVSTEPAGVEGIVSDSLPVKTEYYTIGGLKVNNPGSGIFIERTTHEDGTVTVRKIAKRY